MFKALTELAERMSKIKTPPTFYVNMEDYHTACNDLMKAQRIIAELAKVNHGEASPTPWRVHTDREVRANDERLWIENVVCQTQSCPKTRYTKAEREEWNIPATANTKLIVASVNAVAECRAIAEE